MFAGVQNLAYLSGICRQLFGGVHLGLASTATLLLPLHSRERHNHRDDRLPLDPCSLFALFSRKGLFSEAHHLLTRLTALGGGV